tara:strand:- start:1566 stop:1838 length:273 start_codon:yes stop_codon:yes gene_type:complete
MQNKLALLGGKKVITKPFIPYSSIGKEEEIAAKKVLKKKFYLISSVHLKKILEEILFTVVITFRNLKGHLKKNLKSNMQFLSIHGHQDLL